MLLFDRGTVPGRPRQSAPDSSLISSVVALVEIVLGTLAGAYVYIRRSKTHDRPTRSRLADMNRRAEKARNARLFSFDPAIELMVAMANVGNLPRVR
jgi:hypothetical protein